VRHFGTLMDFSETPTGPYGPAPLVGEHTRRIMERLGYVAADVDDLLARGIVYEPGEDYPWPV
jgi:crotonobetainyl-CoA:carnitine CoA-transferase CaiB-like acyl-CoA transferase